MKHTRVIAGRDNDILLYNGPEVPAFFFARDVLLAADADPAFAWPDNVITGLAPLHILQAILPHLRDIRSMDDLPPGFDDVSAFRIETDLPCTFGYINAPDAIDLVDWASRNQIHCLFTPEGSVYTPLTRHQPWFQSNLVSEWNRINRRYEGQHARGVKAGWKQARSAVLSLLRNKR